MAEDRRLYPANSSGRTAAATPSRGNRGWAEAVSGRGTAFSAPTSRHDPGQDQSQDTPHLCRRRSREEVVRVGCKGKPFGDDRRRKCSRGRGRVRERHLCDLHWEFYAFGVLPRRVYVSRTERGWARPSEDDLKRLAPIRAGTVC